MRKTKYNGSFFICLIFNMLLNFEWTIPAWILLILHFVIDIPIWWFFLALGVWLAVIIIWMMLMSLMIRLGNSPEIKKENKNPYSVKENEYIKK